MVEAALVLASLGIIATALVAWLVHKKTSKILKGLDKTLLKVLDHVLPQDEYEPPIQTLTQKPVAVKTKVVKARAEVGEPKDVTIEVPLATIEVKGLPPRVVIKGQTKEEAQKRLDEDTKKVGFIRGEIYQLDDSSWGIHWGGKYPL